MLIYKTDFTNDPKNVDLTTYAEAAEVLIDDYCAEWKIETSGVHDPYMRVIDDPTAPHNAVLHVHGGYRCQSKLQGMHVSRNPTREFTSRQRMYVHPDVLGVFDPPMEGSSKVCMWQEIRIRPNHDPKSRIIMRWHADQNEKALWWYAGLWEASEQAFWESRSYTPVPIGEWFEVTTRYRSGDAATGRFQVVLSPNIIIHDVSDWTDNPAAGAPRTIQDWNPQKIYSPNEVSFDHLQVQGKALQYYVDFWEFYNHFDDLEATNMLTTEWDNANGVWNIKWNGVTVKSGPDLSNALAAYEEELMAEETVEKLKQVSNAREHL